MSMGISAGIQFSPFTKANEVAGQKTSGIQNDLNNMASGGSFYSGDSSGVSGGFNEDTFSSAGNNSSGGYSYAYTKLDSASLTGDIGNNVNYIV